MYACFFVGTNVDLYREINPSFPGFRQKSRSVSQHPTKPAHPRPASNVSALSKKIYEVMSTVECSIMLIYFKITFINLKKRFSGLWKRPFLVRSTYLSKEIQRFVPCQPTLSKRVAVHTMLFFSGQVSCHVLLGMQASP